MFSLSKGTTKFRHDLLAYWKNDKEKLANASTTCRVIRVRNGTSNSIDDPSIGHKVECVPVVNSAFLVEQALQGASEDACSGTAAAPFAIAVEHLSRLPKRVEQERVLFPENTSPLQDVNAACSDPDILSRRLRKGKSSTKNALKMRNKFDVPSAYKETLCNQNYMIHRDEDLGMMLFGSPEVKNVPNCFQQFRRIANNRYHHTAIKYYSTHQDFVQTTPDPTIFIVKLATIADTFNIVRWLQSCSCDWLMPNSLVPGVPEEFQSDINALVERAVQLAKVHMAAVLPCQKNSGRPINSLVRNVLKVYVYLQQKLPYQLELIDDSQECYSVCIVLRFGMESDNQVSELSQIKHLLRQQQATLDLLKKRRAKSPSPPERQEREFLDVQFQLNKSWRAQLQQALEAEEEEEIKQCITIVVKGLETRIADLRLGDKDLTYFKFANQLRAAKCIKAAGGDSEVAKAWAKLRADMASEGRPKRPFWMDGVSAKRGAGSTPFFASANDHCSSRSHQPPTLLPPQWGTYMFKFDFKSSYYHIDIHPESQKYLGFAWDFGGALCYLVFTVLCFGFSTVLFIFTKVFCSLMHLWRSCGYMCALYLNDGLFHTRSAEEARKMSPQVREDLR
uniref:Uncharacterized protein n=1 Tax=Plectus sambesii TaxID=2011161 RepID=A0A914XSP9_9BILA